MSINKTENSDTKRNGTQLLFHHFRANAEERLGNELKAVLGYVVISGPAWTV